MSPPFEKDGFLEVTQAPFGRRLHIAPAPDGVWIADDDRWEARKYSARGELHMVVRSSADPGVVTDELIEALISVRYRDGGVAVAEFGLGTASPRVWIRVDPAGTAAAIEVPAGLAVKRWGPDWVVGIVSDELDREEIHRYRILAAAGPGS